MEHVFKNVNFDSGKQVVSLNHLGCNLNNGYGDLCLGEMNVNNTAKSFFIDCGSDTKYDKQQFNEFFKEVKDKLDFILYTHWHDDHYGGSLGDKKFKLVFGLTKNAKKSTREATVEAVKNIVTIQNSDSFITNSRCILNSQSLKMYIYHPVINKHYTDDENHYSLMPVICCGTFVYLGLADITKETFPKKLVQQKNNFTVIKLPHHGSKKNIYNNLNLINYIVDKKPICIISGLGGSYITETINYLITNGVSVYALLGEINTDFVSLNITGFQDKWYGSGRFNLGTYLKVEVDSTGGYRIRGDRKKAKKYPGGLIDY